MSQSARNHGGRRVLVDEMISPNRSDIPEGRQKHLWWWHDSHKHDPASVIDGHKSPAGSAAST